MDELIERLNKATGPDRQLDYDIGTTVFDVEWKPYGPRARKKWGYQRGTDRVKFYGKESIPQYTYSLDDAVVLVPDHHVFSVDRNPDGGGSANVCEHDFDLDGARVAVAASPAIALCAAALKARAAQAK